MPRGGGQKEQMQCVVGWKFIIDVKILNILLIDFFFNFIASYIISTNTIDTYFSWYVLIYVYVYRGGT